MTPHDYLLALPSAHAAEYGAKHGPGLTCVCSAHPVVIEAGLIEAREAGGVPCIEATCNQVNQDGGYTGMTPQDFRDMVIRIADRVGVARGDILLGGDHLGPNPWRHLPAEEAMAKAEVMTRAYGVAGFGKIHLDASMSCADDPTPLPYATVADRAARLMRQAEAGAEAGGHPAPAYIIGTEVPVPGGAAEAVDDLAVTSAEDAARTLDAHVAAFEAAGLGDVWPRIVALVVQPGVEFGQTEVHRYRPADARALSDWRAEAGTLVFEAHSTDYQTPGALAALVRDGFAILKVGPGLTFALREALYGLDAIAATLREDYAAGTLEGALEAVLLAHPEVWRAYVDGPEHQQRVARHYGLSDRIRYVWPEAGAQAAIARTMDALGDGDLPWPLISQHLGGLADAIAAGDVAPRPEALLIAAVRRALAPYSAACKGS